MVKGKLHVLPKTGLKGIPENWRNDLIAAISVALVALPLALGVAVAAGLEPMSGIISAVVGGVITTMYRGSHIAINGPAAGLIAVILAALVGLDDGRGPAETFPFVLAAIMVAGGIQVLMGIFRLGRIAEIIPSSVITGILAAIGVIIFSKQMHVALGTHSDASNTIGIVLDLANNIAEINPFVALISLVAMLLLFFHSKISYKLFHFLPAPIWVLMISIPFVYWFNFFEPHSIGFLGKSYDVGPDFLITLPENPLQAIIYPNFSKVWTMPFWTSVVSITLIASVATLSSAKAVDKLDPYKRKTDLNKDLIGVGLSTMVAGAIGGYPVTTVIVRSTVNVQNGGKTKWSNFYHGILLLIFILLLSPVIQQIPYAALAAILVFIGFKLASPRIFKQAYEKGVEQLLFLTGTLLIALFTNLLWAIVGGILLTLLVQVLLARVPFATFFQLVFNSGTKIIPQQDGKIELRVKGILNFLSMIKLIKMLDEIPPGKDVNVNIANARLVDHTVLELLYEFKRNQANTGGKVRIIGKEHHIASNEHPHSLRILHKPMVKKLTGREKRLKNLATTHGWRYKHEVDWDVSYLKNFQFFETRPIELKNNVISGLYKTQNVRWEISDIIFDEGALQATEVYHTTIQLLRLPFEIPQFIIEKEGFFDKIFDRVMAFSGQKDIDFKLFTNFSDKFLLKGEDESAIRSFFSSELISFLESESVYHIESNGEALLIFKYLRLAKTDEASKMLNFSEQLTNILLASEEIIPKL